MIHSDVAQHQICEIYNYDPNSREMRYEKDTITFRLRVQDSYAEGHIRTLLKTSLPTRED